MKTAPTHLTKNRRGFSLFEMLIVVAILGIMVAILVPIWGNNDAFYAARNRRNAQEIVSTSTIAQAAGLNLVKGDDVVAILRRVSKGDTVKRGSMKNHHFSVPGLSEEDLKGAAKYVTVENGELRYSTDARKIEVGGSSL
jgi:prepilin-type N-terminal cleavage/methylation domain-containing protein